jgi:phosphatidylserine/phosphatidylglycerophosphate/cardiolipin synthase-like enzyme
MQALTRAADRGVHIRIYLDGTQLAEREPAKVFNDLAETPGVEIRIKHDAPQELPNRRQVAAHRRELFRVRTEAAGQ